MWNKLEERITRAISSIVYSVYGRVGFRLEYENGKITLDIYNSLSKNPNKKVVKTYELEYPIEGVWELKAVDDIVSYFERQIYAL